MNIQSAYCYFAVYLQTRVFLKWSRGDSAYDPPRQRLGVHTPPERDRDLRGRFALLSSDFYYFGDQPVALPQHSEGMVKKGPGHREPANAAYVEPFEEWLGSLHLQPGSLYGEPQEWLRRRPGPQMVALSPRPSRH